MAQGARLVPGIQVASHYKAKDIIGRWLDDAALQVQHSLKKHVEKSSTLLYGSLDNSIVILFIFYIIIYTLYVNLSTI